MSLNIEQKKVLVAEVHEVARSAQSVVAAEYRGLTVTQLTVLRAKAREAGVYVRVVKNTLARKAVEGTSFEPIGSQLKGPGAAARLVKDFAKTNDKLVVTLVSLGGAVLSAKSIEAVASLPTREQALSMLLGTMKAPIEKFVRTLAAPHTKLVRTVDAVRDQKQGAAA